jgi:hypothetical protein
VLGTLKTSSSAELAKVLTVLVGAVGWRTRRDGEIAFKGKSGRAEDQRQRGKRGTIVVLTPTQCKSVQFMIRRQGDERDRIGGCIHVQGSFYPLTRKLNDKAVGIRRLYPLENPLEPVN